MAIWIGEDDYGPRECCRDFPALSDYLLMRLLDGRWLILVKDEEELVHALLVDLDDTEVPLPWCSDQEYWSCDLIQPDGSFNPYRH